MDSVEIKNLLDAVLQLKEIYVKGENGHFEVIAVDQVFNGMTRVKKQQRIYGPLMDHISSNAIHAVSIKTFTPEEWVRAQKLNGLF